MTETTETLGERLRRLRREHKLSQNQLARLIEMSPDTIYKLEAGKQGGMRPDTAQRYAAALSVTPVYLLYGLDEGPPAPDDEWPAVDVVLRRTSSLSDADIRAIVDHINALEERDRLRRELGESPETSD